MDEKIDKLRRPLQIIEKIIVDTDKYRALQAELSTMPFKREANWYYRALRSMMGRTRFGRTTDVVLKDLEVIKNKIDQNVSELLIILSGSSLENKIIRAKELINFHSTKFQEIRESLRTYVDPKSEKNKEEGNDSDASTKHVSFSSQLSDFSFQEVYADNTDAANEHFQTKTIFLSRSSDGLSKKPPSTTSPQTPDLHSSGKKSPRMGTDQEKTATYKNRYSNIVVSPSIKVSQGSSVHRIKNRLHLSKKSSQDETPDDKKPTGNLS